jgi:hypothetical protein
MNIGYVQGMSDLCAPIYVIMGADETLTFWCFVAFMDRMVSVFYFVFQRSGNHMFISL